MESDYIARRIAAISMTLSDLQRQSPTTGLFRCDYSHSFAAIDKISTDIDL